MSEVIRLLPDHIANQIAAGEVIQRPSSVVKELVENAIDAGATSIELVVKDAGKTLLQVIDNGGGMSEIDLRMSIERHATSKIQHADDLFALTTKGFRGEALASIAAISHLTIKSKQEESDLGSELYVEGSKVMHQEECVGATGTCISVKNLFFNVPARRNFLKSDQVEFKHIVEEFTRIALSHGDVGFKLIHNDSIIHDLPSANMRKRIVDVFGKKYNDKLVPIEENTDIVKISGFVGKPEFAKKTRGEQYFFVNNRFFKHSYFNHAVTAAFENLIPSKTHPSYFLFLEVDPHSIDVNVHPTKTEIKFEEEKYIYSILRSAVKLGLGKYNIAPTMDFNRETEFDLPLSYKYEEPKEPTIQVNPNYNPFEEEKKAKSTSYSSASRVSTTKYDKSDAIASQGFGNLNPSTESWENFYEIAEEEETTPQQEEVFEKESTAAGKQQFVIHGKYLFSQIKSGVMLIHIKRAKERVLYDELMANFMLSPIASQQLLFPFEQELTKQERIEWENNKTSLERLGFHYSFEADKLVLAGIPSLVQDEVLQVLVDSITEKIAHHEIDKGELAHSLISTLASAAAMSGTKGLKEEEKDYLIEQLFQAEDHMFSPSGLKIIDTLSLEELTKRFA